MTKLVEKTRWLTQNSNEVALTLFGRNDRLCDFDFDSIAGKWQRLNRFHVGQLQTFRNSTEIFLEETDKDENHFWIVQVERFDVICAIQLNIFGSLLIWQFELQVELQFYMGLF